MPVTVAVSRDTVTRTTLRSEKNTRLYFLSYLLDSRVHLNKKCSECMLWNGESGTPSTNIVVVNSWRWRRLVEDLSLVQIELQPVMPVWLHLQVVRFCIHLSSRYGATLPTRRHPVCRGNVEPLSPVDILVRPAVVPTTRPTTIELLPSRDLVRGTVFLKLFVMSSGTFRQYLKTYLFSLFSTEQQPTNFVKRPCSSFLRPLTTCFVSFTLHYTQAAMTFKATTH